MEVAQLAHVVHVLLQTSLARGAVTGFITAAAVDYAAFRSWRSWDDVHRYSWGIATWRWTQGAIAGAVGALGIDALV